MFSNFPNINHFEPPVVYCPSNVKASKSISGRVQRSCPVLMFEKYVLNVESSSMINVFKPVIGEQLIFNELIMVPFSWLSPLHFKFFEQLENSTIKRIKEMINVIENTFISFYLNMIHTKS